MFKLSPRDFRCPRGAAALPILPALLLAAPLYAATILTFTGADSTPGPSGIWNDAGNWNPNSNFPDSSSYDAYIPGLGTGPFAVTLTSNIEINGLYLDSSGGGYVTNLNVGPYTLQLDQTTPITWPTSSGPVSAVNVLDGFVALGASGFAGKFTAQNANTPLSVGGLNVNGGIIGAGTVSNFDINVGPGGQLLATNSTSPLTLTIDTTNGSLSNSGLVQSGVDGNVYIKGPHFTNFSGGTLTGGTYNALATGSIEFDGAAGLNTLNNAQVFLNGGTIADPIAGTVLGNGVLPGNLTITGTPYAYNGGGLTIADGQTYNTSSTVQNNSTYYAAGYNVGLNVTNGTQLTLANLYGTGIVNIDHASLTVTGNLGDGTAGNSLIDSGGNLNGNLVISSGSFSYNGANLVNISNGATLLFGGGSLTNNGANALSTLTSNQGLLTLAQGSTGTSVTLSGNLSTEGVVNIGQGASLTLASGATYTQNNTGVTNIDGELMTGTYTQNNVQGTYLGGATVFSSSGELMADTVNIYGGEVYGPGEIVGLTTTQSTINLYGGTLGDGSADGLPNISTDVLNVVNGTLILDDPASLDVLSADLMGGSTTILYLDSPTSFDSLNATDGSIELDGGDLELVFEDGFMPSELTDLDLFTATGGLTGTFGEIDVYSLNADGSMTLLDADYSITPGDTPGSFDIVNTANTSTPEPGTGGLLMVALGAAFCWRRRRR